MRAEDVRSALRAKYSDHRRYAVAEEVGLTTGFSHRRLDMMVLDCYFSNGFRIDGFEIKISTSDLRRELEDPEKSDCIVFNKAVSYKTLNESLYTITSTKAEKKYTTPICEPLRVELDGYIGQSPFFFGGDRPLPWETVRRRFDMYIKKADVKRIRLHDLRHSFVSMLIHLGANMTVVADLIGDTIEQVTKTYGHMYEEDKISIMRRLK